MADLKAFAEQLVNLTVKEVNELAEILKTEYGIEPAAAGCCRSRGSCCRNRGTRGRRKNSFDVVLKSPGAAKLAVIKTVKELPVLD